MMNQFTVLFLSLVIAISCGKKVVPTGAVGNVDQLISAIAENDTLEIDQVIDLKGRTIQAKGKVLSFSTRGKLKNGIIVGSAAKHLSGLHQCYENIIIEGTWKVKSSYLEWFGGGAAVDASINFQGLRNAIIMGEEVLLKTMYPVAMKDERASVNIAKAIILRGESKEKAGLVLETKSMVFFPYFSRPQGNDLKIENLTITTRDYINGIRTNIEAEYYFMGSYYNDTFSPMTRPAVNYVEVEDCILKGSVSIVAYGAHSANQAFEEFKKANYVKRIFIKNNQLDFCNSPFGFSNVGYDEIIASHNIVKNSSSTFIGAPISGISDESYLFITNHRGNVTMNNNTFENDRVINTPKDRAMSPCVIKGGKGTLLFENNKLKNLINGANDSDTYTFYFTCGNGGKVVCRNNTFLNVLARSSATLPSCLIKDRGATDFTIEDNTFEVQSIALVKLGLLSSEKQTLSSLDGKQFYFSFMQNGSVSKLLKKYVIRNNVFKMPYVNISTEISEVRDMLFENNTMHIGHYGESKMVNSASLDNVLFLGNKRLDPEPGSIIGNFIFQNNKISIASGTASHIDFINYIYGVQNGYQDIKDKSPNFDKVVFNDQIKANYLNLSYTLLDGRKHNIDIIIDGINNQFSLSDPTGANHLRPNTTELKSRITLGSLKSSLSQASPMVVIPNSTQTIYFDELKVDEVHLMSYSYLTALYNILDQLPVSLTFKVKGMDSNKKLVSEEYNLIIESQYKSFCHLNEKGTLVAYSPADPYTMDRKLKGRTTSKLGLNVSQAVQRFSNAIIYLSGCNGYTEVEIQLICKQIQLTKGNIQSIEPMLKKMQSDATY